MEAWDAARWNAYFAPGGGWEQNAGRRQTRIFAECFCRRVAFDRTSPFSLLDFGCALGDGLQVFQRRYPQAVLTGMDFAEAAIRRCQAELDDIARFLVGGVADVTDRYDVVYASNVLEHFPDYRSPARRLLAHCGRLCLMVPYDERDQGNLLTPDPNRHHQHTFLRDSFDFLREEGLVQSVSTHLVVCPGAWGRWNLRRSLFRPLTNRLRHLLGKPPRERARQIIYDIVAVTAE